LLRLLVLPLPQALYRLLCRGVLIFSAPRLLT